ncbi:MAG: transcription elongation factor GreA [Clostridia bacterium]|jgi:transcription elongation factor GreA|nr:transcription elongation factor GreA [Clostridia bacterium]MBQ5757848.1 transcription elongation factor GreA [Clostridia bacterium]MCR5072628.1 transcription elongation factor GreA [Clostridiales bacterium]
MEESSMAEIWLTADEIKKREERLEYLKGPRRLEIAEMLKVARAFGDLSENAEYDAAKDEQAKNEYDIAQLEQELKNAKVIDESTIDTKTVSVGTTVQIEDVETHFEMTYKIVGSAEADPLSGRISNDSPVGSALLGHKLKQTVEVQTPGGTRKLRIKGISK